MVNAGTEPQVAGGFLTFQIKLCGTFEFAVIAICCGIANVDHGTCGNGRAVEFNVFCRHAEQTLNRSLQAHHLFAEGFQVAIRVGLELRPHVGVFYQQFHAV
jgi:hypothetical protein